MEFLISGKPYLGHITTSTEIPPIVIAGIQDTFVT